MEKLEHISLRNNFLEYRYIQIVHYIDGNRRIPSLCQYMHMSNHIQAQINLADDHPHKLKWLSFGGIILQLIKLKTYVSTTDTKINMDKECFNYWYKIWIRIFVDNSWNPSNTGKAQVAKVSIQHMKRKTNIMQLKHKHHVTQIYFNHRHLPIVTIFDVLLRQLPGFRHLMPIWALSASCTFTTHIETANMSSISLVIWSCPLKLQNGIIRTGLPIGWIIVYASSGLHLYTYTLERNKQ